MVCHQSLIFILNWFSPVFFRILLWHCSYTLENDDTKKKVCCLFFFCPTLNLLLKIITVNVEMSNNWKTW